MTCPICKSPTEKEHRPFCSKRCANIDLGRWFSEGYAIPAPEEDADELPQGKPPNTPPSRH